MFYLIEYENKSFVGVKASNKYFFLRIFIHQIVLFNQNEKRGQYMVYIITK